MTSPEPTTSWGSQRHQSLTKEQRVYRAPSGVLEVREGVGIRDWVLEGDWGRLGGGGIGGVGLILSLAAQISALRTCISSCYFRVLGPPA